MQNPVKQDDVAKWQDATFGSLSLENRKYKLCEEIIELCDAVDAYTDNNSITNKEALAAEIADVQIVLFGLAASAGIDVEKAARTKFDLVKSYVWQLDEHGEWKREKLTPAESKFIHRKGE